MIKIWFFLRINADLHDNEITKSLYARRNCSIKYYFVNQRNLDAFISSLTDSIAL